MEQCLEIIDQSLGRFHAEKPDARLESLNIEMQVSKELWGEILTGLSRRLSSLDGEKAPGRFDIPDEVGGEIRLVLEKSARTAAIKTLLRKHAIKVRGVHISQQVIFKDSLTGRKWADIAILPGVGVLGPGIVEFDLDSSRYPTGSIPEKAR
jgi:hypothetical protein